MGHTILGDITHPAPVVYPPAPPSQWPLAIGLAMATLFPTAGLGSLAAYFLTRNDTAAVTQPAAFDDSSISIGLGRIEDYIKDYQPSETP